MGSAGIASVVPVFYLNRVKNMKSRTIVKTVQRYGIMYIPEAKLVEVGFNTQLDAEYSCKIHQRVARNPEDFSVVPTSVVNLQGTKEQIEGWLGRGIEEATAPPIKEILRPKCPPFSFTQWGYQKSANGITHDDVWFEESVLKSKGLNLLKRLSGTKSKPHQPTFQEQYLAFVCTNPFATHTHKMMYVKRLGGLTRKAAKQYIKNQSMTKYVRI